MPLLILFGISVCRVFQIAQAHHEQRKLWEACEAAAATASIINSQEVSSAPHSSWLVSSDLV